MISGKLYFVDKKGKREFIKDLPTDGVEMIDIIDEDLKNRRPKFMSYYKRMWFDDDNDLWVDFGSHTEFYVVES